MEPLEKNKKSKIDQAEEELAYVRLNKFIADAGICSRRNAETLIKEGRIEVNGKVMTELGYKVDVQNDWVKLDKKRIQPKNAHEDLVYAFNKPKRCVSTLFDPEGRETLLKYIPKNFPRLFPVGRLDYDTEGLLLLTNAGRLANQIAHPSGEVWKTYLVKIKGSLTDQEQAEIKKGPVLRGEKTLPTVLKVLTEEDGKSWLELKLREGKNHQIKQIFFKLYKPVLKIKRVQVGSVKLGNLKLGEIRRLTKEELKTLKEVAGKKASLKVSNEEKLAKHEQHKKRVKAERPFDRDDF